MSEQSGPITLQIARLRAADGWPDEWLRTGPLRNLHELLHESGAVLASRGILAQLTNRLVRRLRSLVRTFRRHRVIGIDEAHDVGEQRDLIPGQFVWIARSVRPLMMMTHDRTDISEEF